jgi:hypothetical protein
MRKKPSPPSAAPRCAAAIALAVVLGAPHASVARQRHAKSPLHDRFALAYAGYLGGNTSDQAFAIAVDANGDAYVAGSTESANLPVVNALQAKLKGTTDAFVARVRADGSSLIYSTYLGGSGLDVATAIALDAAGNAYVTGFTSSGDFPVTPGVVQKHMNGKAYDAFVAKISPTGALVYATYLGGTYVDVANAIAVDAAGDAHVAGYTCSFDFPVHNAFQPSLKGAPPGCFSGQDAFVAKLDADATSLPYSTFFGGSDEDEATAIALDPAGRIVIAGQSASSDLPVAGGALAPFGGGRDAFVARFEPGGALGYASDFGGIDDDVATGVAVGKSGDLYVGGYTASADLPTWNAFQPSLLGDEDGFVLRFALTASGASIAYSTYFGGGDADRVQAIAVDADGKAYVTGYTESLDLPTIVPTQAKSGGSRDAFVARFDAVGTPTYSTYLGGSDDDVGWHLAVRNGFLGSGTHLYVAGETLSAGLGTTAAFGPNAQGASDGFAAGFVPSN